MNESCSIEIDHFEIFKNPRTYYLNTVLKPLLDESNYVTLENILIPEIGKESIAHIYTTLSNAQEFDDFCEFLKDLPESLKIKIAKYCYNEKTFGHCIIAQLPDSNIDKKINSYFNFLGTLPEPIQYEILQLKSENQGSFGHFIEKKLLSSETIEHKDQTYYDFTENWSQVYVNYLDFLSDHISEEKRIKLINHDNKIRLFLLNKTNLLCSYLICLGSADLTASLNRVKHLCHSSTQEKIINHIQQEIKKTPKKLKKIQNLLQNPESEFYKSMLQRNWDWSLSTEHIDTINNMTPQELSSDSEKSQTSNKSPEESLGKVSELGFLSHIEETEEENPVIDDTNPLNTGLRRRHI